MILKGRIKSIQYSHGVKIPFELSSPVLHERWTVTEECIGNQGPLSDHYRCWNRDHVISIVRNQDVYGATDPNVHQFNVPLRIRETGEMLPAGIDPAP